MDTRDPGAMSASERAAELTALDQRRALLHRASSTSNPADPPKPNDLGAGTKKFIDMSAAEQTAWKRKNGLR